MAKAGEKAEIPEGGFTDREQLQVWLKDQPREVSSSIAWRSAARAFPLLFVESPSVVLPVFISIALARIVAFWPGHESSKVCSTFPFQTAHGRQFEHFGSSAVHQAAYVAAIGNLGMAQNTEATMRMVAIDAADAAFSVDAPSMCEQLNLDVDLFLTSGIDALNRSPLWFDTIENFEISEPVPWAVENWKNFAVKLNSQPAAHHWWVWNSWYDDILHGKPGATRNRDIEFARLFGLPDENADIVVSDWEAGPENLNPFIAEILARLERRQHPAVSEQVAGPYRYTFSGGKIGARPHTEAPVDDNILSDLLAELQQKADDFSKLTKVSPNCAIYVSRTASKIQSILEQWDETPSPGQLLSALRSLEANVQAFDTAEGREELFPTAIAMMIDLRDSLHDMVSLYPVVQQMQANSLALNIQNANVSQINIYLDETAEAAAKSDKVDDSAVVALNDGKVEIADATQIIETTTDERRRAAAVEERAQKTANRVLSMRNFSAAWLRAVQDGVIEGSRDGTKNVVKGGIVVGSSALVGTLVGVWPALAVFISSFAPFAKKAEELQDKDDDLTNV